MKSAKIRLIAQEDPEAGMQIPNIGGIAGSPSDNVPDTNVPETGTDEQDDQTDANDNGEGQNQGQDQESENNQDNNEDEGQEDDNRNDEDEQQQEENEDDGDEDGEEQEQKPEQEQEDEQDFDENDNDNRGAWRTESMFATLFLKLFNLEEVIFLRNFPFYFFDHSLNYLGGRMGNLVFIKGEDGKFYIESNDYIPNESEKQQLINADFLAFNTFYIFIKTIYSYVPQTSSFVFDIANAILVKNNVEYLLLESENRNFRIYKKTNSIIFKGKTRYRELLQEAFRGDIDSVDLTEFFISYFLPKWFFTPESQMKKQTKEFLESKIKDAEDYCSAFLNIG